MSPLPLQRILFVGGFSGEERDKGEPESKHKHKKR